MKSTQIRVSTDFDKWLKKHSSKSLSKVRLTKIIAEELRGRKYRL